MRNRNEDNEEKKSLEKDTKLEQRNQRKSLPLTSQRTERTIYVGEKDQEEERFTGGQQRDMK